MALLTATALMAQGPVNIDVNDKTIRDQVTGEPYKMYGKRIVFTNWLYVHPGSLSWADDQGRGVAANRNAKIEDWGAHFRTSDTPRGIQIVAQPAQRRFDPIAREKPWEARNMSVWTLLKDGDTYKFWGSANDKEGNGGTCYLESTDGINWERPNLGMVEYAGNNENNLIPSLGGRFVFIDPSASPEHRYKSVGTGSISREQYEAFKQQHPNGWEPRSDRRDVGEIFALQGATSRDGLNWTMLPEPLAIEHADTQNTGCYDPILKKYVLFTRSWMLKERDLSIAEGQGQVWFGVGRRSIGRSESDTFSNFPVSQSIVVPPPNLPPSEVLYTNCYTTIPEAPDQRLMFPAIWDMDDDATRLVIASSPDGRVWDWVPGGTVLDTNEFQQPDGGSIFASPNLVELPNGDFVLPYNGYRFPHKYPRGGEGFPPTLCYAVWPKGRIIALEAPQLGEFSMVGIVPTGTTLRINATTRRGGWIQVEACGLDRKPLPGRSFADCKPIIGDQYRATVTWTGGEDLGIQSGQPVALKFKMNQAKIFALEFE